MRPILIVLPALLAASFATAHEGVMNPAVKARMDAMVEANAALRVVGGMARGRVAFDAELAAQAKADMITALDKTPALFAAPETDPKSEALPAIWSEFARFTTLSDASVAAARGLDTSSLDTLRAGMGDLGSSCSACHESYRMD